MKGIHWIAKPLGDDSLVCYSMGDRRGYINMLTGEQAIAPQYRHAWVFSDCLASVDDDGWIKFVDATNQWHSSTRERAAMPSSGKPLTSFKGEPWATLALKEQKTQTTETA